MLLRLEYEAQIMREILGQWVRWAQVSLEKGFSPDLNLV